MTKGMALLLPWLEPLPSAFSYCPLQLELALYFQAANAMALSGKHIWPWQLQAALS